MNDLLIITILFPIVFGIYFAACKYQHVKVPEMPERIRVPLAFWINFIFGSIVITITSVITVIVLWRLFFS